MQNCYTPMRLRKDVEKKNNPQQIDLLKENSRLDGRGHNELRQIFMKTGVISHAAGSAYIEMNNTKIVCGIYGPRADSRPRRDFSDNGELVCDVKFAPFARGQRNEKTQSAEELELSSILKQALSPSVMLQRYPKSVIDIYVTILDSDGGEISGCIMCASLALADASVELLDLVACSGSCVSRSQLLLDPCHEELQLSDAHLVVSYMPSLAQVTHFIQKGKMSYPHVQEAVQLCTDANSGLIYEMMRASLVSQFIKEAD